MHAQVKRTYLHGWLIHTRHDKVHFNIDVNINKQIYIDFCRDQLFLWYMIMIFPEYKNIINIKKKKLLHAF